MVGHSTGGMFVLSVPELREHLAGVVLIGSAPHAEWRKRFFEFVERNPIPAVEQAAELYDQQPDDVRLRNLTLAAAPWNFTGEGLSAGRKILADLPYNRDAVLWAEENFDDVYRARWTPVDVPALIISGEHDKVVDQSLWREAPGFDGPNVLHRTISDAGHFPWVENPDGVSAAFTNFAERL